MPYTILVIDDDNIIHTIISKYIGKTYQLLSAFSAQEAFDVMKEHEIHLIISDLVMPGTTGLQFLIKLREMNAQLPVIMISSSDSAKNAVEALKWGAYDYMLKPFDAETLRITISKAIEKISLSSEVKELKQKLDAQTNRWHLVGNSKAMLDIYKKIELIASSESTVLISGESGTGKEMVAEAIQKASARREKPFLKINCAAIPTELLENELFGHAKGAYTGAYSNKDGLFLNANFGIILLDEIGEVSLSTQVKLLRVLQNHEFIPVGSTQTIKVNVRVIAITNRDLDKSIKAGTFRDDLYYRLNVISIKIPPLRERREDIPLLARHFLKIYTKKENKRINGFSPKSIEKLMHYDWPGNAREVQNIVESAVVMTNNNIIRSEDLVLPNVNNEVATPHSFSYYKGKTIKSFQETKKEFEKKYLISVLELAKGNVSLAAKISGIDRKGFYNFINKYKLNVSQIRKKKFDD